MAEHNDFGKIAEEFVARKYKSNGYKILERNWYFHPAEIDIIATRDNELIVVEVKARANNDYIDPAEAVNRKKKKLLVKAANEYMELNDISLECRFDIAVVLKEHDGLAAEIIVDAFEPFELD